MPESSKCIETSSRIFRSIDNNLLSFLAKLPGLLSLVLGGLAIFNPTISYLSQPEQPSDSTPVWACPNLVEICINIGHDVVLPELPRLLSLRRDAARMSNGMADEEGSVREFRITTPQGHEFDPDSGTFEYRERLGGQNTELVVRIEHARRLIAKLGNQR